MLHKIRYAMGKRDANHTLCNEIELDKAFLKLFPIKTIGRELPWHLMRTIGKYKCGKGSQKAYYH
tara:strand:+ start:823 stop:1017 length:195 start_codon:yes stop_codon:yes gene_type:complete